MLTLSFVKIVLLHFDQPISEGPTPKDQLLSQTKLSVCSVSQAILQLSMSQSLQLY